MNFLNCCSFITDAAYKTWCELSYSSLVDCRAKCSCTRCCRTSRHEVDRWTLHSALSCTWGVICAGLRLSIVKKSYLKFSAASLLCLSIALGTGGIWKGRGWSEAIWSNSICHSCCCCISQFCCTGHDNQGEEPAKSLVPPSASQLQPSMRAVVDSRSAGRAS